ncbi:class I SAM-dependent methyltransferase [Mesorhizobium australicum]|uniref:class I SAM-dependent methyltransferase n=1 Tax=Mesorhizobium TaxID=68287 RepID=UPI0003CDFE43|nr:MULTISPECIES: class I SAM-dependent methyltransferase [unclassified Mesorhizobium]ESY93253.1 type 11 methyltransferase [Mesorhizobium sp. LNHC229A00]ESZ00820.1 type 11 methyltransferase [Mesorhizobium sp. LNHC209A00]
MANTMAIEKKLLNSVHDRAVFQRRVRILCQRLADELGPAGTVLDLGCGDGSIAKAIMEKKPGLTFRGIDVLIRPQTHIPVELFDGGTIPAANGSYDWVTIVDVLHHADHPGHLVREAARVARKGVVIKDHLREGFAAYQTLRFMDWVGNKGHNVRLPYNYLSKAEWDAVFAAAGITPRTWREKLSLYPFPASVFFDRRLHFISTLR